MCFVYAHSISVHRVLIPYDQCIHTLTMNSLYNTNLQAGVEVRVMHANPMGTYAIYSGDLRGLPGHGPGGLQVTPTECH